MIAIFILLKVLGHCPATDDELTSMTVLLIFLQPRALLRMDTIDQVRCVQRFRGVKSGCNVRCGHKNHPKCVLILGTRLYREPATKSNRTIILNAIEFVVFPGVVNRDTRERVLDVIDRCDCSHFLLLFRDQKCQFRGLYAYYPDTEEVYKIYGTGPKQVTEKMFDSFFK